ncbi:fasciclin domain-containing protein [Congregibacter sp.]|uniref:fasciclin domain-containing protein n=1 Tax=Congregibacter sp. TaxID=2744308 RepID=UPI003F6D37F0
MKMLQKIQIAMVLMLATAFAQGAHHEGGHDEMPTQNIVEIAAGNPDFSTLVAAVQAAGLVDVLAGEGPFTVFAPTNAAFAKLPEGTVETLLLPENKDQLTAVLTYHVVAGKVMAAEVVTIDSAATVQGEAVSISTSDAGVMVDGAMVVMTDIEALNGVIHVIDTVILPGS